MKGLSGEGDPGAIQSLHDDIRIALTQAEAAGEDATRERATYLSAGPDPQSLLRTLRRLRNDLAAIGRTTAEPLPEPLRLLAEPAARTAAAIATFLHANGQATANQKPSPSLNEVDAAFAGYAVAVAELRKRADAQREGHQSDGGKGRRQTKTAKSVFQGAHLRLITSPS